MNTASGSLKSVSYGEVSPPPGEAVAISPVDFDATLACLKHAFKALDLWLIHEIDPQMLLARDGYPIGKARQWLFFHPRYAARLLEANPAALIEIPLKIAVLQMPDGRVLVRHMDIEAQLLRYPGMAALASELADVMRRVLARLA
ncbi:DUF302 domain-containing protein [Dyella sp. EPa41]|uniref:DUF302 domain-containing protein n=1 Tax=Dyella sp. EPa41 TaxID=1561194 RepID=UPI00191572AF|nr:DUF302 domain-containing protein [Dyella sp. EPa41]